MDDCRRPSSDPTHGAGNPNGGAGTPAYASSAPTSFFDFFDSIHASPAAQDQTQVHPQETNQQHTEPLWPEPGIRPEFDLLPAERFEQSFRHSGWSKTRRRVYRELKNCCSRSRVNSFACCGAGVHAHAKTEEGKTVLRLSAYYCHDRFCIPCANAKAATIQRNLIDKLNGVRRIRFTTLTLKHRQDEGLISQVKRLYSSFIKLRRRKFWKLHVDGGAAFMETKIGRDGLWHSHLHVLVEGEYMPKETLSAEWKECTTDSMVIDIRAVGDFNQLAAYVTKYITKCAPLGDLSANHLQELIAATRGLHVCMAFGTWRGWKLTDPGEGLKDWLDLGNVKNIFLLAIGGDELSLKKAALIAEHFPLLAQAYDAHRSQRPPP